MRKDEDIKMKKEITTERQDSINLVRGANGKYRWEIKLYFENSESKETIIKDIKNLDKKLKDSFENK